MTMGPGIITVVVLVTVTLNEQGLASSQFALAAVLVIVRAPGRSATGCNVTLWQAVSPAAASASPATLAQFENWAAVASLGRRTNMSKLRGPKRVPGNASRSSRTLSAEVQVKGICVGCTAQGSGGLIEMICADDNPVSLSEIVTGAS